MSLRLIDSCNDPVNAGRKYDQDVNLSQITAGRYSGNSYPIGEYAQNMSKTFDPQSTWICGAAVNTTSPQGVTPFFRFYSVGGHPVAAFGVVVGGAIILYRYNAAGTLIEVQRSTTLLRYNTWAYVEIKVTGGVTGAYTARLNGKTVLNGTADFRPFDVNINQIVVAGGLVGNVGYMMDDIYIADGTAGEVSDFIGDVRVDAYYPTANGSVSGFTPSAGANWECVDEVRSDTDTTYVAASAVGTTDLYNFADIADGTGTIKGVQSTIIARKDDSGDREIAPVWKQSGVTYVGTSTPLNASYEARVQVFDKAPDGSSWTPTIFNAAEFGVRVTA